MKLKTKLWSIRESLVPWLPLPCRSIDGDWYLVENEDEIGEAIYFHRIFEDDELRFVRSYLHKGMTFLDIGANQGLYTILSSKLERNE